MPGVPPGRTWSYSAQIANMQLTGADLLLVVSNAPSMRAKQQLLILALPGMIRRLVWPKCVDYMGNAVERTENTGTCPRGMNLEFEPYRNLRVGVITTSLGGHGSDACPRDEEGKDDRAYFIPKVRSGVPDPDGTGFLTWRGKTLDELEEFTSNLAAHIEAVGTNGCAAPAPLEAWYRALVDPSPPEEIVLGPDGAAQARRSNDGEILLDEEVLIQRQDFLRPTSLVSIVVVSDQDDCSLMDGGVAYENAGFGHRILDTSIPMTRPTDACAENPNHACCFPCSEASRAPDECDVSACEGDLTLPPELDRPTVRCFDTKRRFGVDPAYPVERYVDGLVRAQVVDDESGELVDNPLLRGVGRYAGIGRDPNLVFLTGVVGVPWQDVATAESLSEPSTFRLRTSAELDVAQVQIGTALVSRWDVMLGEPGAPANGANCENDVSTCGAAPIPPLDPFLIPSIEERPTGLVNPISKDTIVESAATSPIANDINGHEADHSVALPDLYPDGGPARDRLQASCIFPLSEPLECEPRDANCLCSGEPSHNAAACAPPEGGPASLTQYFAEAYPAPRLLQVLRDVGPNSIVAPLCPKIAAGDVTDPHFGFNPALEAMTSRLAEKRGQRCFPRQLSINDDGFVPCIVVEGWPKESLHYEFAEENAESGDPCAREGRSELNPTTRTYVENKLREAGRCGGTTKFSCEDYRLCAIDQLQDEAARDCLTDPDVEDSGPPGFCYVDPSLTNADGDYVAGGGVEGGNPIVANCRGHERRLLRFVGQDTPRPNTVTLLACQMSEMNSSSGPEHDTLAEWLASFEPERGTGKIPPDPSLK